MRVLFLLFIIMPIIEIALLVKVGGLIGAWNTIGIVIVTAFVGAYLVRREGFHTLQAAQQKMQRNELPGREMLEGLLLVISGVLLVTPGFVTDIFGFLLVLPPSRHVIANMLSKHVQMQVVQQASYQQNTTYSQARPDNGDVFEGEFTDKTENDPRNRLE